MGRLSKHFRRWNKWRRCNMNSKFYQFLVLVGFVKSPSMCLFSVGEDDKYLIPFEDWCDKN